MNWRHLYPIGAALALGASALIGRPSFGVEFSNGQITPAPAEVVGETAPATGAPQPGGPHSGAADGQPAPTPVAAAPAVETPPAAGIEAADEPQTPEDASIQDDIEDPTAGDEAPAPEPQVDATPGPRTPRHGVPVPVGGDLFPISPVIERQKAFWIHAFTAMTSRQGLLHDGRIIGPTYETVDFDEDLKLKEQNAIVRRRIQALAGQLNALAERIEANQPLDESLEKLRVLLPQGETPDQIRERIRYIRFQRGLSDRFRNGLMRSGAILEEVRRVMNEHGVPADLAYLPHVESSFNNATLSKAGAAGIWQFTRGTGKIFLTVQGEVDERLDPLIAARAAAIFLKQNHDRLGTWPLAITAYNHGPQSLEKIVGRTSTVDLGYLIENYNGPLFKFASKNFYSEFLAARHVAMHYQQYFGDVELARPLSFARVELPFYLEFTQAARAVGVALTELAALNPSLRPSVLTGAKLIPKGFRLRVPPQVTGPRFLAAVPESARAKEQKISTEVRVARGDTLFSIGRRNNIPWTAIAAANNLGPRSRLFVGQRLILPRPGQAMPVPAAVVAAQAPSAPSSPVPVSPAHANSTPAASAQVASAQGAPAQSSPAQAASAIAASPLGAGGSGWDLVYMDGGPLTVAGQTAAAPAPAAQAPAPAVQAAAGGARTVTAATAPTMAPAHGQPAAATLGDEPTSPIVSAASLVLHDVDPGRQEGVVRSVYGETLGHYADWAQVPALEIRERNGLGAAVTLRPGRQVVIPLHAASAESFNAQRVAYHRARELNFFSAYTVREKFEVRLTRGQSIWAVAQEHNVPMWLLYRENPALLERPAQAGMRVIVPRVEEAQPNPR